MDGFALPFSMALMVRSETPDISERSLWLNPRASRRFCKISKISFIMCNILLVFNLKYEKTMNLSMNVRYVAQFVCVFRDSRDDFH